MDKKFIRKSNLKIRDSISNEIRSAASKTICTSLINLETYKKSQKIALYMATRNEVDTQYIWQNAILNNKQCYFPKITNEHSMIFLPGNKLNNFTKNKWGIFEPDTEYIQAIPIQQLDIIILPIVAFDKLGHRIGMGKGFFDRALENNQSSTLIGVAYEFQKLPFINSETWDIKLDIIVTEMAVYYT